MRYLQISILAATLSVAIVTFAPSAAATTKSEASALCSKRGSECVSFGIGDKNPGDDIIYCVDNRSTGNGVQCVRCTGATPCTVLREIPTEKKPFTAAEGVLTNSIERPDVSGLNDRVRMLEEQVKALEKRK
jgi:hypothetical protein